MYIYRTYFKLTACVNDFDEAYKYLKEDNMVQYIKGDITVPEDVQTSIISIDWILKELDSGYIELKTNKALSAKELESISEWVSGQCSDGLGEGFEQQSFACYCDEGLSGYDESDWDDEQIMASFDWQTNKYIFEFIKQE